MNILFTGNLYQISKGLLQKLEDDYKCVVYDKKNGDRLKGKKVVAYEREEENEDEIFRVFSTFDFDTVVFFSYSIDGRVKIFDELEKLESTIFAARKNKVRNFIYVYTNDTQNQESAPDSSISRGVLLEACENLCRSYAEEQVLNCMLLQIPYLYNRTDPGTQLFRWMKSAEKDKKISIRASQYKETDFLCDEDLGELLARILDEPKKEVFEIMQLSGENRITFSELAEMFRQAYPELEVKFENHKDCIPICNKDSKARAGYGWFPKHILADEFPVMAKEYHQQIKNTRKSYERRKHYKKLKHRLRVAAEIAALFVIAEALNYWTGDNVLINFMDFRLLFVIIIGTMNGLNAGVAAAVLSSIGYIADNAVNMQWQVLFYNVENWLPFACYILLGAVTGYTRDKHDDEVLYEKEEHDILEKKYVFLNELYIKVLERKDSYNSQILGYHDSYGKLYGAIKKLDTVLPEEVLLEAVSIIEELLDNNSVAIYTINESSSFARLDVCSRLVRDTLTKSLKVSAYPQLLESLSRNQVFVNTEALEGYPAYAAPVIQNGKLVGMIELLAVQDKQMNMEFSNKFSIVCDLIRDSIIRAREFEDLSDSYLPGTQILKREKFGEILAVKEQMKEKQYMDFVLLKITKYEQELTQLSEQICEMIRNNDVLGEGEDGGIYLLLSQIRVENLGIVSERMKARNIAFEVVKG